MRILRLKPDWKSSPLKLISVTDIDDEWIYDCPRGLLPEDLPLSQKLKDDLWAWIDWYDTQMDWENAPNVFEWSDTEKLSFIQKGYDLQIMLSTELGTNYEILYDSKFFGTVPKVLST